MDITWKRCVMSVFPTGVVATEDSDQFGNSHSQASCEKLKSAQKQPHEANARTKPRTPSAFQRKQPMHAGNVNIWPSTHKLNKIHWLGVKD